jgi:hypothetical protein
MAAPSVPADTDLKLKYVRLASGEVRFCYIEEDHSSLVNAGERAVSAGIVIRESNGWILWCQGSVTCNLLPHECLDDDEAISNYLGPRKNK